MSLWDYAWSVAFCVTVLTLPAGLAWLVSHRTRDNRPLPPMRPAALLSQLLGAIGVVCLVELSLVLL